MMGGVVRGAAHASRAGLTGLSILHEVSRAPRARLLRRSPTNDYDSRSLPLRVAVPLAPPLIESHLPGFARVRQGKVRDLYEVGDDLLIVATDRISAFDYVLGSGIPDKGRVLTQLSAFWFARTAGDRRQSPASAPTSTPFPPHWRPHREQLRGRAMLVRKTTPLPVECVARGYLSGSGWKDYVATGAVCGIPLARRPARVGSPARADLHARHQSRLRPRPEHPGRRGRADRRRRSPAASQVAHHGALCRRAWRTPNSAASSSPTPSSSSV